MLFSLRGTELSGTWRRCSRRGNASFCGEMHMIGGWACRSRNEKKAAEIKEDTGAKRTQEPEAEEDTQAKKQKKRRDRSTPGWFTT